MYIVVSLQMREFFQLVASDSAHCECVVSGATKFDYLCVLLSQPTECSVGIISTGMELLMLSSPPTARCATVLPLFAADLASKKTTTMCAREAFGDTAYKPEI